MSFRTSRERASPGPSQHPAGWGMPSLGVSFLDFEAAQSKSAASFFGGTRGLSPGIDAFAGMGRRTAHDGGNRTACGGRPAIGRPGMARTARNFVDALKAPASAAPL